MWAKGNRVMETERMRHEPARGRGTRATRTKNYSAKPLHLIFTLFYLHSANPGNNTKMLN